MNSAPKVFVDKRYVLLYLVSTHCFAVRKLPYDCLLHDACGCCFTSLAAAARHLRLLHDSCSSTRLVTVSLV